MNRHHPYGGGYDGPPNRRGGPGGAFGPGLDRHHRFSERGGPSRGRGGFRGGRGGGGGSYGAYESYDQGPPQGDMGGYNSYESGPPQEPFYGNGSFDAGMGQYGQQQQSDSGDFDEGFGNYEGALEPISKVEQQQEQQITRSCHEGFESALHVLSVSHAATWVPWPFISSVSTKQRII